MMMKKDNLIGNLPPDWVVEAIDRDPKGIKDPKDVGWVKTDFTEEAIDRLTANKKFIKVSCSCSACANMYVQTFVDLQNYHWFLLGQCYKCHTIYWQYIGVTDK